MTEQRKNNGISSGVAATITTAAVAVAGMVGYFTLNNPQPKDPGTITQQQNTPNTQNKIPNTQQEKTAEVFWLKENSDGTGFILEAQKIQVGTTRNEPSKFLKAAFENLLKGPTEGSGSSNIPQGTELLGLEVKGDEIRVNLSEDFQFGGGSASMIARVGQVVYTATALNPKAKVYLELNGEKVEVIGGEGLELQQPLTRKYFDENFEL